MKEKLTRNIGLKVLSIILAALLWILITNVANPIGTRTFSNVPVKVLNEEVLTSRGQVFDITKGDTVTFTVAARRSILDDLRVADFKVTADLAHLSDVYAVQIDITSPRYGDQVVITSGIQMMLIKLEELLVENIKVDVVVKGEVAGGYYIGEKAASPNFIGVSGPRGRVESIDKVIVEVDVNGLSDSYRTIERPIALDAEGNVINSDKIEFNKKEVMVNIKLLKTKKINLQITAVGEPAFGYIRGNVEYDPKTIEVAGTDEALRGIKYLDIKENISGASEDIEKEIDLQERLAQYDVILVGEDKTAVINISIEPLDNREVMIWPREIEVRNKPYDLNLTFNTVASIPFKIMGSTEDVLAVSKLNLKPYIDLTDFSIGTYLLEVESEQINDITLANKPTISITLTD